MTVLNDIIEQRKKILMTGFKIKLKPVCIYLHLSENLFPVNILIKRSDQKI